MYEDGLHIGFLHIFASLQYQKLKIFTGLAIRGVTSTDRVQMDKAGITWGYGPLTTDTIYAGDFQSL